MRLTITPFLALLAGVLSVSHATAQSNPVQVSAYVDAYYASDNDESNAMMGQRAIRQFSTIGLLKDQFALNTAQVSVTYSNDDMRGTVTLHAGSLRMVGWDPIVAYPIIQEANVGVRVATNVWLDAGHMLTHIGGEAVLPKDNWLSSHALITTAEPFYQTGVRASYGADGITAQVYVVNGYNVHEDNNKNKSAGVFVGYSHDDFSVSYAGLYGNEGNPTGGNSLRIYNNIVAWAKLVKSLEVKAQVDIAMQDDAPTKDKSGSMVGGVLALRYAFNDMWSATVRGGYIGDEDRVVGLGIQGMEATLGVELKPTANSFVRLEGRMMKMDEKFKVFLDTDKKPTDSKMEVMLGMGLWL